MGEKRKTLGVVCKAGGKGIGFIKRFFYQLTLKIDIIMGRSEIIMIIELLFGFGMVLLIVSNKLGEYSWIIWVLVIVFGIYKINKEGFDF